MAFIILVSSAKHRMTLLVSVMPDAVNEEQKQNAPNSCVSTPKWKLTGYLDIAFQLLSIEDNWANKSIRC